MPAGLTDGNDIVGYIALRVPADDSTEQRLGFVIVDDSKRGRGYGKTLVSMAVKYAFEELGTKKVSLGVFENNPSAIHCYEAAGFHRVSLPGNRELRETRMSMSFNKGYTPAGYADKVFHIHFHISGDNDEIRFRDYLIAHPDVAKEYERLKLSLLPKYRHDRDGYTEAKTAFVRSVVDIAKNHR